jgi:uncharacterized phage infection (PIP) family protein YhgE
MELLVAATAILAIAAAGRIALDMRERRRKARASADATFGALAAQQGAEIASHLVGSAEATWTLPAEVRARLEAAADSLQERAAESERLQAERAESLRQAVDASTQKLESAFAATSAASEALYRRLNERVATFERQILAAVDAARAGEEEVRREIGEMRKGLAARGEAERAQLDSAVGRTMAGLDAVGARLTELRANLEASAGERIADLRGGLEQRLEALEARSEAAQRDRAKALEQHLNRTSDVSRASVEGVRKEVREMQGAFALRMKASQDATTQQVTAALKEAIDESARRAAQSERSHREQVEETRTGLVAAQAQIADEARVARQSLEAAAHTLTEHTTANERLAGERSRALDERLTALAGDIHRSSEETGRAIGEALSTLADRSQAADGRLADAAERLSADAERQLIEVRSRIEEQLNEVERVTSFRFDAFSEQVLRGLEASRAEAEGLTHALPDVVNGIVGRLEADRGQRAADAEQQRADLVAAAAQQLEKIRTTTAAQIAALETAVREQAEALTARSAQELRRAVDDVQAGLSARMDAENGERAANTYTMRTALDSLAARAGELEQHQEERLEHLSRALVDALDTVSTRTGEARAELAASTAERLTALRTALEGRLVSIQSHTENELAQVRDQLKIATEAMTRQPSGTDQQQAVASLAELIEASRRELADIREEIRSQLQSAGEALSQTVELQRAEHERSASLEQQVSSSSDIVRTSGEIIHALRSAFDALLTRVTELERSQRDTLNEMREFRRQRGSSYWERQH